MNEINQKHQSIKFDFKFSKESIEFLDTLVFMDARTDSRSPSTKNQLTVKTIYMRNRHTRSHLKKVFRIVRHSELRKYSQDLIKRFAEKSYNESTARKQIERVDHLDRSL